MNVALINATCGHGSTGSICVDLADNLIEQGHKCTIFYGNGTSDVSYAKKITPPFDVKAHGLLSRITGLQGYFSSYNTKKLIKEIKNQQFDLVHLHNLHGNYVNVPLLLSFLKKNHIPTVITLHDCWFYTGKCTHYKQAGCLNWQRECGNCPQLKKDIPSLFFDCTKKMLNDKREIFESFGELGVIGVSDWITKEAENSILKNNKIKTIYNWVDTEKFFPQEKSQEEKFTVLGVSAKWTKNAPKLLDFVKLADKLPEDIDIVLVGKKDKDVYIPDRIKHISYLNGTEELTKKYSDAGVYVHLSREDSFGKVIVEAMACGTPAIVYDSTACPELVGENCGYIVSTGDVDAVRDRILEIKKVGKKIFSENCIKKAKTFNKSELIAQTIDFYKEMIGE